MRGESEDLGVRPSSAACTLDSRGCGLSSLNLRFLFENRGHGTAGYFTVSYKGESKEVTPVMGSGNHQVMWALVTSMTA